MADTSPHRAHRQRVGNGIHREMGDRPAATSRPLLLDTDVAERRRWRCVHVFGDSTRTRTPTPRCWRRDPRERILLAHTRRAA